MERQKERDGGETGAEFHSVMAGRFDFEQRHIESCSHHSIPWGLGDSVGRDTSTPSSPKFCPRS